MSNDPNAPQTDQTPQQNPPQDQNTQQNQNQNQNQQGSAPQQGTGQNQNADANPPQTQTQAQAQQGEGYASEDSYATESMEGVDVWTPDSNNKYQVAQVEPFAIAALIEEHNIKQHGSADGMRQMPDDLTTDDDAEQALEMVAMIREGVVPNILRPRHAYWGKIPAYYFEDAELPGDLPDEQRETARRFRQTFNSSEREKGVARRKVPRGLADHMEFFDLTKEGTDDLLALLGAIVGEDPEEMKEQGLGAIEAADAGDGEGGKFQG